MSAISDFGSISRYLDLQNLAAGDITLSIISVFIRGISLFAYLLLTINMFFVVRRKPNIVTGFAFAHTLIMASNVVVSIFSYLIPTLNCDSVGITYGVLLALGFASKHVVFMLRAQSVMKSNKGFSRPILVGVALITLFIAISIAGYSTTPTYKDNFGACGFSEIRPLVNFSAVLNIINDIYFLALFLVPLYQHILVSKLSSANLAEIFEEGLNSVIISSIVSTIALLALNLSFQPELFVLIQMADYTISSICIALLFVRLKRTYKRDTNKYIVRHFYVSHTARKRQLYALALIAACIASSQATIYALLQNNDSTRVNIAGRQRMLSQRLALECYEATFFNDRNDTRASTYPGIISSTLELWQTSQLGLIYGSADLGLQPETESKILSLFRTLQPIQQRMLVTVDTFIFHLQNDAGIDFNDTMSQAALKKMTENRLPFLSQMNGIVEALQGRGSTDELVVQVLAIEYALASVAVLAAIFQMSIVISKSYGKMKSFEKNRSTNSASSEEVAPPKSQTVSGPQLKNQVEGTRSVNGAI